jgi:hypothetical protein
MRYFVAIALFALPMCAEPTKPLPGHVTLVKPVLPAKKPLLRSLVIPPPPPPTLIADNATCAHIVIVPVDPTLDSRIIRSDTLPTHQMPTYSGSPACR